MKEFKKVDAVAIAEKFDFDLENKDFIFKSQEITPKRHFEPQRSALYS